MKPLVVTLMSLFDGLFLFRVFEDVHVSKAAKQNLSKDETGLCVASIFTGIG